MSTLSAPATATSTAYRRVASASMTGAALLAVAGFTALGSVFEYPQILKEPTDDILAGPGPTRARACAAPS